MNEDKKAERFAKKEGNDLLDRIRSYVRGLGRKEKKLFLQA